MAGAVNSRHRFDPFTGSFRAVLITAETHIAEYYEENGRVGFFTNEGIRLDTPSSVEVKTTETAPETLTECSRLQAPNSDQYRVDYDASGYYNTGFVELNPSRIGEEFTIKYYGLGTIMHPTYRLERNFNLPGNVSVEGDQEVGGDQSVLGNASVEGNLHVGGTTGGDLTGDGDATFEGNVAAGGNLSAGGNVSLAEDSGATVSVNNKQINDVADPVAATDAVNKQTMDAEFSDSDDRIALAKRQLAVFNRWNHYTTPSQAWDGMATNGQGTYIAITTSNNWAKSTDYGKTWTTLDCGYNQTWSDIAYANGTWIATARSGTNRILRSTNDGASWSPIAAPEANAWFGVAGDGAGTWIAVSDNGTNRVMRSTDDGLSWSAVSAAEANTWYGVAYGNGVWVAVATSGTNRIMRSTNGGTSWTAVTDPTLSQWMAVATDGAGNWVIASNATNLAVIYSTDNGTTWLASPVSVSTLGVRRAAYGNNQFVLPGNASGTFLVSTDGGLNWSVRTGLNDANAWSSIAFGDGVFVCASTTGTYRACRLSLI